MKRAFAVAGMAFGDEGKGTMVDYLVRRYEARLVVRYNGGPQAAHNVVTDEGVHHTFSQFGSGTLAGARTYLSKYMLIDPFALNREAMMFPTLASSLTIDPDCVIITPYHRLANRIREASRGSLRHGSCGAGVGEARADALHGIALLASQYRSKAKILWEIKDRRVEDLRPIAGAAPALFVKLMELDPQDVLHSYCDFFESRGGPSILQWPQAQEAVDTVIFEGAQGVLLDEVHGFAPHNTWTDCTFANADRLADEVGITNVEHIGVFRSYFTRHGAGPFPTECPLPIAEAHNAGHPYMGPVRVGVFDAVLAQYALRVCPVDCLALTHLDRTPSDLVCEEYSGWDGEFSAKSLASVTPVYREAPGLAERIEALAPVSFHSYGPTPSDKKGPL